MLNNRFFQAFCLLLIAAFVVAAALGSMEQGRLNSANAYSDNGLGISLFKTFAKELDPELLRIKRTAFLDKAELEGLRHLLILSPTLPLSEREAQLIEDFVKEGGNLLLSFHTPQTANALLPLLKLLQLNPATEEVSDFENGKALRLSPPQDSLYFSSKLSYALYSSLKLSGPACQANAFNCYVQTKDLGKGTVSLIVGIPVLANSLIAEAGNKDFAISLTTLGGPILLDEYHHYFKDKSVRDLLLEPSFALPVLSLVLSVMAFFIFARSDFHRRTQQGRVRANVRGYHEMNQSIVEGILRQPETLLAAVERQAEYLKQLFPEKESEISAVARETAESFGKKKSLRRADALIKLHQEFLKDRGGQL